MEAQTQRVETTDIYRRHLADKPMVGLTDEELRVLVTLGGHLRLFEAGIAEALDVLVRLAEAEDADRVMRESLAPKGGDSDG